MVHRSCVFVVGLLVVAGWLGSSIAVAQQPAEGTAADGAEAATGAAPSDPQLEQARELYKKGVSAVQEAQWGEALSFFERSEQLRAHATTLFNVGACERALGRYTRAHHTFQRSLARAQQHEGELAPGLTQEAQGFVEELEGLFARLKVTVEPADAQIAVDGRPLSVRESGGTTVLVAGVLPPGPKQSPPIGTFEMVVDPGAHVVTLGLKGFTDVVLNYTFAPGERRTLNLNLKRLPAVLRVSSNVEGALVTLDGRDLGPVPVDVRRAAGSYRVEVFSKGYEPYEAQVTVQAGEESTLRATLAERKVPLTKRWWFWTGAAAVVAGGVLTTYALTRPEPSPPPYESGNTNWLVTPTGEASGL